MSEGFTPDPAVLIISAYMDACRCVYGREPHLSISLNRDDNGEPYFALDGVVTPLYKMELMTYRLQATLDTLLRRLSPISLQELCR